MPDIIEQVLAILLPAAATLLAGWLGILGTQMKIKYNQKIDTEMKKAVVEETVQWVQQVWDTLEGPAKLQKALERAGELLTEKGIPVSEKELNMLIESSVYGLKQGFAEPLVITEQPELLKIEAQDEQEAN